MLKAIPAVNRVGFWAKKKREVGALEVQRRVSYPVRSNECVDDVNAGVTIQQRSDGRHPVAVAARRIDQ